MREKNWKKNLLTCFGAAVLFVAATLGFSAVSVHAESGSVYSCTINRCYSHPVTGEIEDSGGEASYATGQGMVEGAVYASGLMEVTDSGNYYLTIRMSLIDYTSGHSFSVQNVGDSGWSGTGIAVTANGSDSNGTTSDICIQVPSENCIVRVSMYVTPMGRDVTFYLYPSDYSEGNSVGMNPAFVTEEAASAEDSGSGETVANSTLDTGNAQEAGTSETADAQETDGTESTDETTQDNEEEIQNDAAATQAAAAQSTAENDSTESASTGNAAAMNSGNTVAAAQKQTAASKNSDESDTDKELNSAQGLNLSTAEEDSTTSKEKKSDGESSVKTNTVFAIALAVTGSGLFLILVTALIIWYFRKNWRRWGGEDDDDDEY